MSATENGRTHYTPAETAKCIRTSLKKAFPACKFSVRTSVYAGGASIRVSWTDGPTDGAVKRITSVYEGAGFDGMIDMKYNKEAWVVDGEVIRTTSSGTEGSMGVVPAWGHIPPHDDAVRVSFGADYVFTERAISPTLAAKCIARIRAYWGGVDEPPAVTEGYRGYAFPRDFDGYRPIRADLDGPHYSWHACIHRAAEDATEYVR